MPTDQSNSTVLTPLAGSRAAKNAAKAAKCDRETRSPVPEPTESAEKSKGLMDVFNRTLYTVLMAYFFLGYVSYGAMSGIPLVVLIVVVMFYEITRINKNVRKERQIPSVQIVKGYLLLVSVSFMVLHNIREPVVLFYPHLEDLYRKLPFAGFCALMTGLVGFVFSLKKGAYRYQFIQLTWTIMTLIFIVTQCAAEISNMMRGMIWFLLPCCCVIFNDIWAYIFGKTFGRTKLLALSPKKTVEGFIGAFFITVWFSFKFSGFLSHFPQMYCAAVDYRTPFHPDCVQAPLFVQTEVEFPAIVQTLSRGHLESMMIAPVQLHALVLGVFASLLAPFGGFFASGLKRAFKIKDFGDLIPGHGGMSDRMDCQGIMGLCTYFYLRTYVYNTPRCASFKQLSWCVENLGLDQKQALLQQLTESIRAHAA